MPLVRISIPAGKGEAFAKSVSEGVHDAMVVTIDIPQADRFQVITEHDLGGDPIGHHETSNGDMAGHALICL